MDGLLKKIEEIEKEISRTQKNKATEFHLGQLRARLNKYRKQLDALGNGAAGGAVSESEVDPPIVEAVPAETKKAKNKKGKQPVVKPIPAPKQNIAKTNAAKKAALKPASSESSSQSESESEAENESARPVNRFLLLDESESVDQPRPEEASSDDVSDTGAFVQTEDKKKKRKKKPAKQKKPDDLSEEELLDRLAQENLNSGFGMDAGTQQSKWSGEDAPGGIIVKYLNYRYELQKAMGGNAALMEGGQAEEGGFGGGRARDKGPARTSRGVQHLFVTPAQRQWPEHLLKDFVHRYNQILFWETEIPKQAKAVLRFHMDNANVKSRCRSVKKAAFEVDDLTLEAHGKWLIFRRSRRYKDLQREFLLMVYTNQDQAIQDILHEMPLHADASLLLSGLYERDGNAASARQAVENVLIGYQACFDHHQRNNPQSHRLSYRHPANRAYFIALYKHTLLTVPRFPKTALQLGKYLFNLSPKEDPLAIVLVLDHLALKARDYSYLLAFYQALRERKKLDMLPNFVYSVALATFMFDQSDAENSRAERLLMEACFRFPGVVPLLFEKMEMSLDRNIAQSTLFRSSQFEDSSGLELLQALYVRRSVSFWKEASVLTWLRLVLKKTVDAVSSADSTLRERLDHYRDLRKNSYRGTPSSIWRHVILMNIPENETVFQLRMPDESGNFVFPFDPVPPSNTAEREECDLRASQAIPAPRRAEAVLAPRVAPAPGGDAPALAGILQQAVAAAGLFFQTLLPSSAQAQAEAAQDGDIFGGNGVPTVVMGAAIEAEYEEGDLTCGPSEIAYMDRIGELYGNTEHLLPAENADLHRTELVADDQQD